MIEVAPGLYRVRAFVGRDPVTGKKRQIERRVHGTKAQANKVFRDLRREADEHRQAATVATVGYVMAEYARHAEARGRAPRYVADIKRVAEHVLPPEFRSLVVSELTARHLDELYRRWSTGDVDGIGAQSPSSIRRHHALISAALAQAVKWEWLERNVAERATLPALEEVEHRVPTPDEVRQFIVEASKRNEEYAMLVLLAVATATRLGEFCALRWSHIDGETIDVKRSLYRVGDVRGEKVTKGRRGRAIALDPMLAFILSRWRDRCEKRAAQFGVTLVPDAFIVSAMPDGSRPINPETFSAFQSRLAKELGIDLAAAGRNPFRHAGGTELLAKMGNPREGADLLGHADPAFFLRRYTHATTARQREAAGVLAAQLPAIESLSFLIDNGPNSL